MIINTFQSVILSIKTCSSTRKPIPGDIAIYFWENITHKIIHNVPPSANNKHENIIIEKCGIFMVIRSIIVEM